jgi:hypothetical protein
MFSDLDSDDFTKLGKVAGIVLFAVSFVLPAVTSGRAVSRADYFFASDAYHGFACAGLTLFGTVGFIRSLFGPDRIDGSPIFFVISGWITPLVLIVGIVLPSVRAKRIVAMILPFLLTAPFLFFATSDTGGRGSVPLRPLIGHYVWTLGCLLIFTPQCARMLGLTGKIGDEGADED